jgi:hypothetical protein
MPSTGDSASIDGARDLLAIDRPPPLPHLIESDREVLFTTFEAWTVHVSGGAAVNLALKDGYAGSPSSAQLTADGNGSTCYIESPANMPAVDLRGSRLRVAIKVSDRSKLRSAGNWVELTVGDTAFKSYLQFSVADAWSASQQTFMRDGEWKEFSWPWPARGSQGTADKSAIAKIRFRIYDNGGGEAASVQLGKISLVPDMAELNPNGLVTLWFDDGWDGVYTRAFPIMRELGARGTCAIINDLIGTKNYMTLAQLEELAAAGWDIVEHSPTLAMHKSSFPSVDPAALADGLTKDRAWLAGHGFSDKYLAYPNGIWSVGGTTDARAVVMAAGFTAARTTWADNLDAFPPSDPFLLRAYSVNGTTTTTERVRGLVQNVFAGHSMLGFVYHQIIDGTPTAGTQISADVFREHVTAILDSGVSVRPISEVLP